MNRLMIEIYKGLIINKVRIFQRRRNKFSRRNVKKRENFAQIKKIIV